MNSGFAKRITKILILIVLLATGLITYIIWGEKSRVSVEKKQSIDARLSELSRKLSVPVKVFDFATIHEALMSSTLTTMTDNMTVLGPDNTVIYSNNQNLKDCSGNEFTKDIFYQNYATGKLKVCLKETNFSSDGLFWVILLVCLLTVAFIIYILVTGIRLTSQLNQVESFISNIDPEKPLATQSININDGELLPIYKSVQSLVDKINENNEEIKQLKIHEAVSKEARSVAHDIKSPLTLMKTVVHYDNDLTAHTKSLLNDSIFSIERICNDILDKYKEDEFSDQLAKDTNTLSSLWRRKKIEHMDKGVNFEESIKWDQIDKIERSANFKRTLSNLINNAVEALSGRQGTVSLESLKQDGKIIVKITDNGPGIDQSLVEILGQKEITTKTNGNGIGVLNAKRYLDSIRGVLRIESGSWGTSVFVEVPFS